MRLQSPKPRKNYADYPKELSLWFVQAKEVNPPKDEDPIDWCLWTTLPVECLDDAVSVLRIYKARWRIEELFRALKTGCGFANTRFESRKTSSRALALHLPLAVGLLRLRALGTVGEAVPASEILDPVQLEVLQSIDKKLPGDPTAADAMWAIARMGGFLPQNKTAGWLVLGRGFSKLLTMSAAWKLARQLPLSAIESSVVTM